MYFLQKMPGHPFPRDRYSILSYEGSSTPAYTLCWIARDGPEPVEEQAGLFAQAVGLQRGFPVTEAPVRAHLRCSFCTTADAIKGRQQPSAELHNSFQPLASFSRRLWRVFGLGCAKQAGGRPQRGFLCTSSCVLGPLSCSVGV